MTTRESWTTRLRDHCLVRRLGEPTFQEVSDRRGGRTAWSIIIIVSGSNFSARFWYDVAYLEQAREDAAEIALRQLTGYLDRAVEPPPASHYRNTGAVAT